MELETQVQVSGNQLKRQDEDKKDLREQLDNAEQRERELIAKLREQQHKYSDLESKVRTVAHIDWTFKQWIYPNDLRTFFDLNLDER